MKRNNARLYFTRAVLFLLVLLNAALIFYLSAQDGETSSEQMDKVESAITAPILPDYDPEKPDEEKTWFDWNLPIILRKGAHATVFGTLGALIFLFLLTFRGDALSHYFTSLTLTLIYAISDEIHQLFINDRSGNALDVFIDMGGALIFTTAILLTVKHIKKRDGKLAVTSYALRAPDSVPALTLALASDLHGKNHGEALARLRAATPDLILIPGDLMDDKDLADEENEGYAFLRACAALAPTYYSVGNHEIACYHKGNPWRHPIPLPISPEAKERIRATGAVLLDNECVTKDQLCICGLTSGINGRKNVPNKEVLHTFDTAEGYRILLCHHPEYYVPHIKETSIDLIVCGHAHGGQWRIFSQGIYAPGQGLFPRYTAGVLDGRCVISRGIGNHTRIPRIYNTPELVLIKLEKDR